MKSKILGLLAVGLLAGPTASYAVVIYDFAGSCTSGCTGTATAVLTLTDGYVPGLAFTASQVISWAFDSDVYNESQNEAGHPFLSAFGTLPVTSGPAAVRHHLQGVMIYESFATGLWLGQSGSGLIHMAGDSGVWTLRTEEVPEPGALALLGLGLAGLGLSRRRRAD